MTSEETTPTTTEVETCAYCGKKNRKLAMEKFMSKAMGRDKKPFRERETVYHNLCATCFKSNEDLEALVKELLDK